MVNKNKPARGRQFKYGEPLDVKREVKFTESQNQVIEKWQERMGVNEFGDLFRNTLLQTALAANNEGNQRPYVPLLGEIPAGEADWVIPGAPEQYVRPPFNVPENCYALMVKGKSMESAFGVSIQNGFYAFFEPSVIRPTMIVHVEFSDGEFQHKATLKRYFQRDDGKAEFQPLNKDFEKIVVPNEVFVIKGGFYKAWDGISGMEDEKAK